MRKHPLITKNKPEKKLLLSLRKRSSRGPGDPLLAAADRRVGAGALVGRMGECQPRRAQGAAGVTARGGPGRRRRAGCGLCEAGTGFRGAVQAGERARREGWVLLACQ